MSALRDKLKQLISKQLVDSGLLSSSKYRLAYVTSSNADGTCSALLDGTTIIATPMYPVTQGQQVMLMIGDGGKISAVPTQANVPKIDIVAPLFLTGGGKLRFIIDEQTIATTNNRPALRLQDQGSSNVYRFIFTDIVPDGVHTFGVNSALLSKNGQYLVVGIVANNTNIFRTYRLGQSLTSSGVIDGPNNILALNLSTPIQNVADANGRFPVTTNSGDLYYLRDIITPPLPVGIPPSLPSTPGICSPNTMIFEALFGEEIYNSSFDNNQILSFTLPSNTAYTVSADQPWVGLGLNSQFGLTVLYNVNMALSNSLLAVGTHYSTISVLIGSTVVGQCTVALYVYSTAYQQTVNLIKNGIVKFGYAIPRIPTADIITIMTNFRNQPTMMYGAAGLLYNPLSMLDPENNFLVGFNADSVPGTANPTGYDVIDVSTGSVVKRLLFADTEEGLFPFATSYSPNVIAVPIEGEFGGFHPRILVENLANKTFSILVYTQDRTVIGNIPNVFVKSLSSGFVFSFGFFNNDIRNLAVSIPGLSATIGSTGPTNISPGQIDPNTPRVLSTDSGGTADIIYMGST